ncbi:MAG: NF038122 family metalloprotease, partial [Planctomycetaceae bacterium]|nr:NF038122 family metalloprotease [Planctomycetaceae bacterium]
EFNFWFNVGTSTIYVDKTAPTTGANGTLARPYNTISAALAAAAPGTVVRIVGNGGADGNVNTLGDNRAYEIGLNQFNTPLADGATMNVPQGVTVMVDAGAVFKLRQANINVGSFAQGIDMSRGALQVLGTPSQQVTFTSYNNEAIGVDTNPLATVPAPGDWGGLVFRGGTPDRASDREDQGIFVNYVGGANISYGGGTVVVDSQPGVYNPIHMATSRPTIAYNTIVNSASAAVSADPDSFAETLFRDDSSTAEYSRVGPEIHGNRLTSNSINALFVRIQTDAGVPLDVMRVQGRFNDTDIVHVISENLVINGTPGGPVDNGQGPQARLDARLAIDPGVVVKLKGSRIEVGVGAQLIAEGIASNRVIFTSLADDRFGAGGTFDTTGDGSQSRPAAGDWGGLYFHPVSTGSIDHSLITFAGGTTPIEGTFANFNAIEVRQAAVRIANSILEVNADGYSANDRNGRGANGPATIFVRGAQPIVVNNIIRDNAGDALSFNANALSARTQGDWGRSTGFLGAYAQFDDNFGPLVRLNRVVDNDVNGLTVRGATLTAESVWDDTDIVHVLREAIEVPNLHTYGGLRLQSSPTQSLVVKLSGPTAGFIAGGKPLDIDDRIGGSLLVLGTPGHPVVMTSLSDNSVGAGFNLEGQPQTQTLGGNVPTGNPVSKLNIDFRYSTEFAANTAALEALKLAASYWENVLDDPITLIFDISFAALDSGILGQASSVIDVKAYDEVRQRMIDDAVGGEELVAQLPTLAQLQTAVGGTVTVSPNIALSRANGLALGYTPAQLTTQLSTNDNVTPIDGTITFTNLATWDFNRLDGLTGADFVSTAIHEIGHALGFFSSVDAIDGGATTVALTTLDMFRVSPGAGAVDFTNAPRQMTPGADAVFYDGGVFNRSDVITGAMTVGDIPLSNGKNLGDGFQASHWKNRGLLGISQAIGVMDPTVVAYGTITSADSRALGLMGWDVVRRGSPGDWAGIVISQYSNDRNVDITNELEPGYTGVNDVNSTPNTAQFLGTLAANEANGDENRRLGFEIHGSISFDRATDLDVYSFNGTAGTEVWFDIDRTGVSLDTVVELVDANGNVLARSNDSTAESANPNLFTNNPAGNLARTLQRGEFSSYDLYTTNPRDAGMRVVLPGTVGTTNTYYVRVRSLGTNINNVTTGQTSGEYRLQIRLREIDEFPGSTVRFADIRYATTGIKVEGMPAHSPLLGDQTRVTPVNNVFSNIVVSNAQDLGNLLASDRNAISLASVMATPLDVQWYKFTVDYQDIQSIAGFSDGGKTWATVFDIDYADGVSRPNLTLSVFDELGNLVLVSRDSDVADDTPNQAGGSSATDLTRGSFGKMDPFIGSVQLAEGTSKTYYVAISSDIMLPSVLDGTFKNEATNKLIRLEPITSIRRIVDDHIGFTGTPTGAGGTVPNPPPAILPIDDPVQLKTNVVQFTLGDVGLFVSQSNTSPSRLVLVNPYTGQVKSNIGSIAVQGQTNSFVGDLAIRSDGLMYATQSIPTAAPNNTAGRLVQIDPTNARAYIVGQDNIPTVPLNQGVYVPTSGDQVVSDIVDALAYQRLPINVNYTNAESDHYGLYYSVRDELTNTSRLFWANAANGEANSGSPGGYGPVGSGGAANPDVTDNGQIYAVNPGDIGIVTGMAFVQRQGLILDAVGPNAILDGQIFTVSDSSRTVTFEFEKAGNGIGANRTAVNIVGAANIDDVVNAIRAAIVSAGLNITFIVDPFGFGELTLIGAFGASPGNSNLQFFGLPDDGFTLYGVDSRGQFFSLDTFGSFFGGGGPLAYDVFQLTPSAPFTGLAQGPVNLDLNGDGFGGDLVNTVFAICSNGDLYAIDTLTGSFRTDIFPNGATHVSTFLQGATGLAFSPLDFNLWHPTTQQGSDPGHGINVAFDHTRDEMTPQQRVGGASFYFGFENSGGGYLSYPQAGLYGIRQEATQFGVLSAAQQQDLTAYSPRGALGTTLQTPIPLPLQANPELAANTIIGNNYNFPGGAHGALVTNAFSLDGYDYTDKPTLYFNYFMEGSASARVYISADDGATWDLVASNGGGVPQFVSASSRTAGKDPIEQQVQPLFTTVKDAGGVLDNTWRQVRIDIGEYAGQNNLKLKFEVNSGTASNNFKGLY